MASCGRLATGLAADEQHSSNSADAIGAQDTILPTVFHSF